MTVEPDRSTLLHCFLHWEKTRPDAIWLTQPYANGGGAVRVVDYTWRQAGDQARRMAAHLQSLRLPPGSSIGIVGKNSAHWILADLAIWMAGHVTVPLYPTLNADTARYILEHAEVKLLFLGKLDGWNQIREAIPADLPLIGLPMSPRPEVPQWEALIAQREPLQQVPRPKRDALATIVYTSGSTGRPKGVMHSHGSMTAAGVAISQLYALTPDDRMLSYLPLAHVAERAAVESTSLYFGFRVYFAGDLSTFQADLKRARPTVFFSVPRLWTKFYQSINDKIAPPTQEFMFRLPVSGRIAKRLILRELGLNHVRAAITGSAPLPPDIFEWYRKLGLELLECYGMSENFGVSHSCRPGEVRIGYVGSAAPGVQARIAEQGEVEVKSPGQMLGYYKQPEQTAADMTPDGFFKTGDRGEVDAQGRLRITGRVKELFKTSKGKYVAPVPIENKLGNHPRIEAVCVTGPGEPQPFALLMLSHDAQKELKSGAASREAMGAEFARLLASVNASLEDHEQLDYAVVVKDAWTMDNGYLTPTMKIKRSVIEERYLKAADGWLQTKQDIIWE